MKPVYKTSLETANSSQEIAAAFSYLARVYYARFLKTGSATDLELVLREQKQEHALYEWERDDFDFAMRMKKKGF